MSAPSKLSWRQLEEIAGSRYRQGPPAPEGPSAAAAPLHAHTSVDRETALEFPLLFGTPGAERGAGRDDGANTTPLADEDTESMMQRVSHGWQQDQDQLLGGDRGILEGGYFECPDFPDYAQQNRIAWTAGLAATIAQLQLAVKFTQPGQDAGSSNKQDHASPSGAAAAHAEVSSVDVSLVFKCSSKAPANAAMMQKLHSTLAEDLDLDPESQVNRDHASGANPTVSRTVTVAGLEQVLALLTEWEAAHVLLAGDFGHCLRVLQWLGTRWLERSESESAGPMPAQERLLWDSVQKVVAELASRRTAAGMALSADDTAVSSHHKLVASLGEILESDARSRHDVPCQLLSLHPLDAHDQRQPLQGASLTQQQEPSCDLPLMPGFVTGLFDGGIKFAWSFNASPSFAFTTLMHLPPGLKAAYGEQLEAFFDAMLPPDAAADADADADAEPHADKPARRSLFKWRLDETAKQSLSYHFTRWPCQGASQLRWDTVAQLMEVNQLLSSPPSEHGGWDSDLAERAKKFDPVEFMAQLQFNHEVNHLDHKNRQWDKLQMQLMDCWWQHIRQHGI